MQYSREWSCCCVKVDAGTVASLSCPVCCEQLKSSWGRSQEPRFYVAPDPCLIVSVCVQSGDAGRLMKRAGVNGIPHAFIVDRSGSIVHRCELTYVLNTALSQYQRSHAPESCINAPYPGSLAPSVQA